MICMVSCYDPCMFQFLTGMETQPSYHGTPSMTLICEDAIQTADLYYRLHSLMLHLKVPMWVEANTIQFQLYSADTILTVMSVLSTWMNVSEQKAFIHQNMLYSTTYWKLPVRI